MYDGSGETLVRLAHDGEVVADFADPGLYGGKFTALGGDATLGEGAF